MDVAEQSCFSRHVLVLYALERWAYIVFRQ